MKPEWFAGRLRELREAAGLTQQQLADAAGLKIGGIRDLEQQRTMPTWETVIALCKALGESPDAFAQKPSKQGKTNRGRPRKDSPKKMKRMPKKKGGTGAKMAALTPKQLTIRTLDRAERGELGDVPQLLAKARKNTAKSGNPVHEELASILREAMREGLNTAFAGCEPNGAKGGNEAQTEKMLALIDFEAVAHELIFAAEMEEDEE